MGCTPIVGQNHYDRGRTLNLAEVEVYSFPPPPSPPAPGPVILEGSTAGYRCSVTALTMINTAAECQAAASALGLTWIGVNAGAHYIKTAAPRISEPTCTSNRGPVSTVGNVCMSTATLRTAAATTSPSACHLR